MQGMKITVSSLLPSSLHKANKNNVNSTDLVSDTNYKFVSTEVDIPMRNLIAPINGKSDITHAGSTTANGAKTYIIYTLPEE